MAEEIKIYKCDHIGVAGTTAVHVKKLPDGKFEARCGIAMMGNTNMDEAGFKACNYDPFHQNFNDNICVGFGATESDSLEALKKDMRSMADSLWLF